MKVACLGLVLCLGLGCDESPRRPATELGPRDRSPTAERTPDQGARDGRLPAPDGSRPDQRAEGAPRADAKPVTSELLLFDGSSLQFTAADKGFDNLINPGDPLPASNWQSPKDYYDGELRIRYAVESPPNQAAGKIQTCIWTIGNDDGDGKDYFPESCSDQVDFSGTGQLFGKSLVPAQWWQNAGVPLVFSHPERFRVGTVLRGPSGCNVTTYDVAGACWDLWPDYQNMKYRVTMVMVAKGDTFSGWGNYP